MIFTAADVESLSRSLSRWELGEYISEAFVAIACAGELVADLKAGWLTEERKKCIQRRSTILLVAALSASLTCLIRTNELTGSVIGSLGDKAAEANGKAERAISDSSTALTQAEGAITIAGDAKTKADAAKSAAGNALDFARAANKKLADRHISQAQQERIQRSLAKWDGIDIRLPITMVNGDDETWTYASELLDTLCAIPGWSAELDSVNNNSGASNLAVTVPEDAPTPDKSLAKDLATALHDAGIEAKGPAPPSLTGEGLGVEDSAHAENSTPNIDPSHPFNVKVGIQISRRL
ncbi:MAG TPA: hypothetical protein VG322_07025 [Candidatus Acidoferrales bacterium]|jgi:hypothetical protein|nr:hypothetical protein [Candidatus Acidoferrales bacterium]